MASWRLLGWLLRLHLRGVVTVDGSSLLVQLRLLLLAVRGRHVGNLLLDIWLLLHGRRRRQLILVTTTSRHRRRRRWLWSSGAVQVIQLLRRVWSIHVQILHASREVVDGRWSVNRWRGRIQWSREAGRGSWRGINQVRVDPTGPVIVWTQLVIITTANNRHRLTLTRRRDTGTARSGRQLRRRDVVVN